MQKVTEMRLRRRDMDMAERCEEIEFSLYGRERDVMLEEVENSKYLERPLDQTDDDWTSVRQNVKRARRF